MLIGVGIALAAASLFAGNIAVGRALEGLIAVTLGLVIMGAVIRWQVLPKPQPVTPLGPAVPSTLFGFAVSLLACLLLGLALCLRGVDGAAVSRELPRGSAAVTAAIALILAGMVGATVVRLQSVYLQSVNEYRFIGGVDQAAAVGDRTGSTVRVRWQTPIFALRRNSWAWTRSGIAVVSGTSVVAVDIDSGQQLWRYTRADVSGEPQIMSLDGGLRLLVSWDPSSPYVLDARSGQRLDQWHWPPGQVVLLGDPLIVDRPTDGGTAIARLTSSGEDLWSLGLSRCDRPDAVANGGLVLISTSSTCSATADRVLGVAADSGSVHWIVGGVGGPSLAQTSRVAMYAKHTDHRTVLTALRLHDGRTAWSRTIKFPHDERPCYDLQVSGGPQGAIVVCGFEETDADLTWHPASLVLVQNTDTGSPLTSRLYDEVVNSLAVDTRGRGIVTYRGAGLGCVLERLTGHGVDRVALDTDDDGLHCSYIEVLIRSEHVILIDEWTETISSLQ